MKKFILILIASIGISFYLSAQSTGDYRSVANGNWNDATKWEIFDCVSDHVITLPTDSILLDGSSSNDPDGTTSDPIPIAIGTIGWLWTKISGPVSFSITNSSITKTVVKNLAAGIY